MSTEERVVSIPAKNASKRYVLNTDTGERGTAEEWVDLFAEVWENPRADLDRLLALLSPDVVLQAPTRPPRSKGRAAARAAFERAFRAMPDLHGEVLGHAAAGEILFIEMIFKATIGGKLICWRNVDRFLFTDGVAVERIAHFDPSPVRRAMTGSPGALFRLVRMRLGI